MAKKLNYYQAHANKSARKIKDLHISADQIQRNKARAGMRRVKALLKANRGSRLNIVFDVADLVLNIGKAKGALENLAKALQDLKPKKPAFHVGGFPDHKLAEIILDRAGMDRDLILYGKESNQRIVSGSDRRAAYQRFLKTSTDIDSDPEERDNDKAYLTTLRDIERLQDNRQPVPEELLNQYHFLRSKVNGK